MNETRNTTEIILNMTRIDLDCVQLVIDVLVETENADTTYTDRLHELFSAAWQTRIPVEFEGFNHHRYEVQVQLTDAEIISISDAFTLAADLAGEMDHRLEAWAEDVDLMHDEWWSAVAGAEINEEGDAQ